MRRARQRPGADARVQEASKAPSDRREAIMLRADQDEIRRLAAAATVLPTAAPSNPRTPWRLATNSTAHRQALAAAAARRAAMRGKP